MHHKIKQNNIWLLVSENTFKNATNAPINNHYYQFGHDGIGNLTNRKTEPLRQTVSFVSKSHFLDAPYYVEQVNRRTGIRDPDRDLDDQWFYVEPRTGAVFRRFLAYQATIGVFPLINRSGQPFGNITEQLVPYYACHVDAHATDDQLSDLKGNLSTLDTAIDLSIYGGASLAIVCFGVMLWLVYRRKHKEQQKARRQKLASNEGNDGRPTMAPEQALLPAAAGLAADDPQRVLISPPEEYGAIDTNNSPGNNNTKHRKKSNGAEGSHEYTQI